MKERLRKHKLGEPRLGEDEVKQVEKDLLAAVTEHNAIKDRRLGWVGPRLNTNIPTAPPTAPTAPPAVKKG